MRTFSRYLLESPIDELPAAVEGPHPHIVKDTYEDEKKRMAKRFKDDPTPYRGNISHDRFLNTRVYHDPHSGVKTDIKMVHRTPGSTIEMNTPWETVGVAQVKVSVNDEFDDVSSKSGSGFQMPGDIMKKISVASGHLHHFIGEHNPHTVEYDTHDPKRHALYQHMARLYPHIVFKNTYTRWGKEMKTIKRKLKPVAVSESYTVNTNYWNTANINKFILESPIDELPAAVEGTHPHQTHNTYENQKRSNGHWMEIYPHEAPIGFNSHHTYHDPDGRVTTNIEMLHRTPGWKGDPHPSTGVATVDVSVEGVYGDSSQTKSRFNMPGEIMGKIASSSSHLHDFITKHKPHTIEYDTSDPKRHMLYQHMSRLYPRILFRNTGKLKPVERKPKPVAIPESYTVNTNYWNMSNINKFILESPLDELPAAVEGPHPHKIQDTYENEKELSRQNPELGFQSLHVYHDPDNEVNTTILSNHLAPGWTGDLPDSLFPHHKYLDIIPSRNAGIAHISTQVAASFNDKSQYKFHMPGEIMAKIKSSASHVHDFITKHTPLGLHTITYRTSEPKRHALYQHMARLYPHITFKNTDKVKSVKREPKPVAVSESYTQKQMATANKTSRNSGAIGKKAITPAYVKTITGKKHKILDFGSGRDAAHTKSLRKTGRNVTAHEFGANVNKNHNPRALKKKYDTVFASNVLNTASSRKMLSDTLDQMHSAVAPGGALVANLPLSPRKSVKVDAKHLMRQLLNRFGDVIRVGGTKKAPLFHATGPK